MLLKMSFYYLFYGGSPVSAVCCGQLNKDFHCDFYLTIAVSLLLQVMSFDTILAPKRKALGNVNFLFYLCSERSEG